MAQKINLIFKRLYIFTDALLASIVAEKCNVHCEGAIFRKELLSVDVCWIVSAQEIFCTARIWFCVISVY